MSGVILAPLTNDISQSSTTVVTSASLSNLLVALVLVIVEDCHVKPHPSIKNFVEELEHTWGNSEK